MTISLSKEKFYTYNKLIANLYTNPDKYAALQHFLESFKELCFYEKADIYFYRPNGDHIVFENFIFSGWGNELSNYMKVCDYDDALPLIAVPQPITFRSSDIFTRSERKSSKYYEECLEPCNMDYSIEGNIYVEKDKYVCGMGLHRSNYFSDFTMDELELVKQSKIHLSAIAKNICEGKSQLNINKYDVFSKDNSLAFIIYDWEQNILDSNINNNPILKFNKSSLDNIFSSMCNTLKKHSQTQYRADLQHDNLNTYTKITLKDRSYYARVSYELGKETLNGVFVCVLYDYYSILQNLLVSLKEEKRLTMREYDILKYVIAGLSNSEIADVLYISIPTVKKHTTSLYQKLNIEGRHQLFQIIL